MITEIGIISGEIWNFLDKEGDATLNQLSVSLDKPRELILMSLGWLAREGHVLLELTGDECKVSLRKKELKTQ